ncbi:MAG: hypothetical protein IJ124_10370 [Clostridia bacterium]|nr:hypothetical protein [Clostridia bacterium]
MGTGKKIGAAMGGWLVYALVGILVVALLSGGSDFLHRHSEFLRSGKTEDLNAYIAQGKAYPMDEFVSANIKFVAGEYANSTSSYSTMGAKFQSGQDHYYVVVLEDMTIMTVIVSNQADIDAMDRLAEATQNYNGPVGIFDSPTFPSYTVSGRLETLTDSKIIGYYNNTVSGADKSTFNVSMIALNATATRSENILLYIVLPIAAVIILLVVRNSRKKKLNQAQADAAQHM